MNITLTTDGKKICRLTKPEQAKLDGGGAVCLLLSDSHFDTEVKNLAKEIATDLAKLDILLKTPAPDEEKADE